MTTTNFVYRAFSLVLLTTASAVAQTTADLNQLRPAQGPAVLAWTPEGRAVHARLGNGFLMIRDDDAGEWRIEVAPPSMISPKLWTFFPQQDQRTFTLPEAPYAVWVFRNGLLLCGIGFETIQPDYTLSADRRTVVMDPIHAGKPGDVVVAVGFFGQTQAPMVWNGSAFRLVIDTLKRVHAIDSVTESILRPREAEPEPE